MSRPSSVERVLFWLAASLIVAGLGTGLLVLAANWPPPPAGFGFTGFHVPIAITFGVMGLLLVRRRPGNRIGWLLVAEATLTAIQFAVDRLAAAGVAHPQEPWAPWLAWVSSWIWTIAITPLPIVFLVFPDGRPLAPRWWRAVGLLLLGDLVAIVGLALSPGPIQNYASFDNPIGLGDGWAGPMWPIGGLMILTAAGASVLSLVIRWRRSVRDEREQLKWLAFVGIPMVALAGFSPSVPIAADMFIGFGVAMPIAIAIAVLRHRLYDIDELIGRTFVYGTLTAILAGVYTAALKLFNELFVQFTGATSESSVILATLVLAAAFTPVRKALEGFVDRRFKPKTVSHPDLELAGGLGLASMSPAELEQLVRRAVRAELESSRPAE